MKTHSPEGFVFKFWHSFAHRASTTDDRRASRIGRRRRARDDDVVADFARLCRDVRVVNLGQELDLRRLERVLGRELELDRERAAGVWRILRACVFVYSHVKSRCSTRLLFIILRRGKN